MHLAVLVCVMILLIRIEDVKGFVGLEVSRVTARDGNRKLEEHVES